MEMFSCIPRMFTKSRQQDAIILYNRRKINRKCLPNCVKAQRRIQVSPPCALIQFALGLQINANQLKICCKSAQISCNSAATQPQFSCNSPQLSRNSAELQSTCSDTLSCTFRGLSCTLQLTATQTSSTSKKQVKTRATQRNSLQLTSLERH